MVAGFYAVNEFISVLENGAAAGIPIPTFLKETLEKINPEKFEQG
jgi:phage-related holin